MSRSIFVIANHRTGSSCLAGFLHRIGVAMGETLLGASESNPLGHFEDKEIVNFNDTVVKDWQDPDIFSTVPSEVLEKYKTLVRERDNKYDIWGVKDPRLCFTAGMMLPFAEDPRIITIERPRESSVKSLMRRNRLSFQEAESIIIKYDKAKKSTLDSFRGFPTIGVDFESFLDQPFEWGKEIAEFIVEGTNYEIMNYKIEFAARTMVKPDLVNYRENF